MATNDNQNNFSVSKPPRDISSEDLSLDTRLAAQEILNDDSIGMSQPIRVSRNSPSILEWLQERRLRLTVIIIAVTMLVVFIPVWLEVGHRTETVELTDALSQQVLWMGKQAGEAELQRWIETRDVEKLRSFYRETRPRILERLNEAGFPLTESTLSIRVDYEKSELFLGALLDHGDEGRFMTWVGTRARAPTRPLPKANYRSVLVENNDFLAAIISVVGILIGAVWVLPALAFVRRDPTA